MWSWTFFDDFWENEKPLKPNSFNGFRGRSEETRRATPYDSLRENPIVFGFAESWGFESS